MLISIGHVEKHDNGVSIEGNSFIRGIVDSSIVWLIWAINSHSEAGVWFVSQNGSANVYLVSLTTKSNVCFNSPITLTSSQINSHSLSSLIN